MLPKQIGLNPESTCITEQASVSISDLDVQDHVGPEYNVNVM